MLKGQKMNDKYYKIVIYESWTIPGKENDVINADKRD